MAWGKKKKKKKNQKHRIPRKAGDVKRSDEISGWWNGIGISLMIISIYEEGRGGVKNLKRVEKTWNINLRMWLLNDLLVLKPDCTLKLPMKL